MFKTEWPKLFSPSGDRHSDFPAELSSRQAAPHLPHKFGSGKRFRLVDLRKYNTLPLCEMTLP